MGLGIKNSQQYIELSMPLLFLDKISDFKFIITPFEDDKGDYLKCNIYSRHTGERVDTIKAGTFSEIQDIIAIKYS